MKAFSWFQLSIISCLYLNIQVLHLKVQANYPNIQIHISYLNSSGSPYRNWFKRVPCLPNALPVQHVRPSGFFCCWSDGLEVTARDPEFYGQLQTVTEDIFIFAVLVCSANWRLATRMRYIKIYFWHRHLGAYIVRGLRAAVFCCTRYRSWSCNHIIYYHITSYYYHNTIIQDAVPFRPFKVIQGHWFWHQSKARMWLRISPS